MNYGQVVTLTLVWMCVKIVVEKFWTFRLHEFKGCEQWIVRYGYLIVTQVETNLCQFVLNEILRIVFCEEDISGLTLDKYFGFTYMELTIQWSIYDLRCWFEVVVLDISWEYVEIFDLTKIKGTIVMWKEICVKNICNEIA